MTIAVYALLGGIAGALSAVALVAWTHDQLPFAQLIVVAPGLIFGVVIGLALHRGRFLAPAGVAVFLAAAALFHAAAFYAAMFLLGPMERLFGHESPASYAAAGVIAGAIGGGLLARTSAFLMPVMRWPLLAAAGAALGALLPIGNLPTIGPWVFYILWQAGYAASLAAALRARR